jgi:hypothetical protein
MKRHIDLGDLAIRITCVGKCNRCSFVREDSVTRLGAHKLTLEDHRCPLRCGGRLVYVITKDQGADR